MGRTRFIIQTVLCAFGLFALVTFAVDYYYDGRVSVTTLVSRTFYYTFIGLIVSCIVWWDNERRYQAYLQDSRVNATEVSHHVGET
jgi:hypothetical protein